MAATTPKIAVDIDSTLYPLIPAMNRLPGGERVRYEDIPSWEGLADLCAGDTAPERLKTMLDLFDRCYSYEAMMAEGMFPGAIEAAHAWHEQGISIDVMTSRPAQATEATRRYLLDHGYPFDEFDCAPKLDKVALCIERGINVLIDDHPGTIAEAHAAGLTVLTLRWRYNQAECDAAGVPHTTNWEQLGPLAARAALARA